MFSLYFTYWQKKTASKKKNHQQYLKTNNPRFNNYFMFHFRSPLAGYFKIKVATRFLKIIL